MRLQIRWSHLHSVNNISPASRPLLVHGKKSESSCIEVYEADSWGSNMQEWQRPVSNLSSASVLRTASKLLEAFKHQVVVKTVMLF